jgi:hypothetical protein
VGNTGPRRANGFELLIRLIILDEAQKRPILRPLGAPFTARLRRLELHRMPKVKG